MKTILKLIFNFRAMFTICYDANYLDFKNDFLNLPKELEEKVKDAAESEARNVTSYITSLILKDLKEKELL